MDREKLGRLHDLSGRVAIVTGGTRGIGLAIAEGFVAAGASVVVASRKADACERVERHLRSMGGEAVGVATHMGEIESSAALVDRTVETFGRLDIVVNNAANALTLPLGHLTVDAWDKVAATNLRGPVFLVEQRASLLGIVRQCRRPQRRLRRGVSLLGQHRHVRRRQVRIDVDDQVDGGRVRGEGDPCQRPRPGDG